ncbi:transcriptional regulator BetI [Nocardia otitidiscaviarum]|uniref:Transcriptional regulator BetI n=1 Tax=Nocardia otitidiscaviarum TaxID=1823 RepID=A0A379JLQ6_9NOCA|nr:TetR family transcriptional regulator [Nocardia otitidiscaviarum]SUD48933.1 transcriptional regulator BetI [Nocardia otitidiscaviarum]
MTSDSHATGEATRGHGITEEQTESTPTRPDGRKARGQRRREQLVDAALRVAARDGVAAITHRAVAAEAGVAATAGTYYFPTVDDLLSAVITAGVQRFTTDLTARLGQASTVRTFVDYLDDILRHDRQRLITEYELYLLAARRPELRPALAPWTDAMRTILARWTTDPIALTATLAALDGLFLQSVTATPPSTDTVEAVLLGTLAITDPTAQ